MQPNKVPGLDGFLTFFHQTYWSTVVREVYTTCLDFLNGSADIRSMNKTFISLISKVSNPTKVTKFLSISLCSVLYKVILKVLANHLKIVFVGID